jgi:Fungal protein kinase
LEKRNSVDAGGRSSKKSKSNSQKSGNVKQENEVAYAVENTKPTSLIVRNQDPFDNCILCCLVIFPAGIVIRQFQSILLLLEALRDAIKAHRSLFMDGRILYRDISKNNIIITDPREADGLLVC